MLGAPVISSALHMAPSCMDFTMPPIESLGYNLKPSAQ